MRQSELSCRLLRGIAGEFRQFFERRDDMQNSRKQARRGCQSVVVAGAALMAVQRTGTAATLYSSLTGSYYSSGITHIAQQITLSGTLPANDVYSVSDLPDFGVYWSNVSEGSQLLAVDFWSNANTSTASTDALGSANFLGEWDFNLSAPSAVGLYAYNLSSSTPLLLPSGTFTVEGTYIDGTGTEYSSAISAGLSTGAAKNGSNAGFVWDDNLDTGVFTGLDQVAGYNLLLAVAATTVAIPNLQWNSSTGGNWEDTTKWNPNSVPNTSSNAVFNLSSAGGYTVYVNSADSCYNLAVQSDQLTLSLSTSSTASLNVVSNLTVGVPASGGPTGINGSLTLAATGFTSAAVTAGMVTVGSSGGRGNLIVGSGIGLGSNGSFNIAAGSTVTIQNNGAVGAANPYVAGSLVIQSGGILECNNLTLAGSTNQWTGKVDIANGYLDLPEGNLATVTNQVAQSYNLTGGANWNGAGGITSSTAAGDTAHLTAVGVIQNNQGGVPIYGDSGTIASFGAFDPGAGDILVRYTYFGDANLDGIVDGSDYSLIDAGYASQQPGFSGTVLSGWYNGDFNYDGVIDGSDYSLIDNAFNNQGNEDVDNLQAQAVVAEQVAGTVAVPEPAMLSVIGAVAGALALRRRSTGRC
jgi:hypothetical protein